MNSYKYWLITALFLVLTLNMYYPVNAATGSIYVVSAESALLRDYPSPDSGILGTLGRYDQVEYVDSSARGWWKVRSCQTGLTGWMTSDLLTAAKPNPQPALSKSKYYYVNVLSINLKIIPLATSATTGTVQLNDKLEKLGSAPSGWTKVKNPRTGKTGWLQDRYLSSHIVTAPQLQTAAPKKRMSRSGGGKKKKKPERPETPKEAVEEQAQPM